MPTPTGTGTSIRVWPWCPQCSDITGLPSRPPHPPGAPMAPAWAPAALANQCLCTAVRASAAHASTIGEGGSAVPAQALRHEALLAPVLVAVDRSRYPYHPPQPIRGVVNRCHHRRVTTAVGMPSQRKLVVPAADDRRPVGRRRCSRFVAPMRFVMRVWIGASQWITN
jgi:hypothetical protein